jgi:peptidyl-tRNA hydrolase
VKMYILVREGVAPNFAILAAAHGSLSCYLEFEKDPEMQEWVKSSFKKVICRVSEGEFQKAKEFSEYTLVTESSLGGEELALVFKPRKEFPKAFKFYRLWT